MTATLIALGGYLRSGKDEVAGILEEEFGFVRIGFSNALHEAMLAVDPWVHVREGHALAHGCTAGWQQYSDLIDEVGYIEAKTVPEVRRLLQALGTEFGRNMVGENIWSDITAATIEKHLQAGRSVALTGVRFPNEVQMVGSFAGVTVWVDRPGFEPGAAAHASETSVGPDDFRKVIRNDGSLAQLHDAARALGSRLRP